MNASTYRLVTEPLLLPLPSVVTVMVCWAGLAPGSGSMIVRIAVAFAVMAFAVVLLTVTVQVAVLPPPNDTDGPQVVAVCEAGSLSVTEMLAVAALVAPSAIWLTVTVKVWALPTSFTALGAIWIFASTYRLTASLPFCPL